MNKIFTLFATALLALSVTAQNIQVASNTMVKAKEIPLPSNTIASDVILIKETAFDFGKIPQGKPVTHIFEVYNNGKDSLHIVNVQASCGCTTPAWDKEKVQAPGEKTYITVGYNAASEGIFTKTITITYNGTQNKQIIIKGEVWKTPVSSAPENKELANLKD